MEYNENQNFETNDTPVENPVVLKEKQTEHKTAWYWIIALLVLGLLGWYGYTAGWFSSTDKTVIPVELNNGIGDGAANLDDLLNKDLAPIDNMVIVSGESFPVEKTLSLKGNLADGCTYLNDPQVFRDGNIFYVNLTTRREGDVCTEALVPYEQNIGLDVIGLPAGMYTVVINGKQTTFELEQDNGLDFSVGVEK